MRISPRPRGQEVSNPRNYLVLAPRGDRLSSKTRTGMLRIHKQQEDIMTGKLGTSVGLRLALFFSLAVILAWPAAARAKQTLTFKESYMVWDQRYWPTKPVRGGTFRQAVPEYIGLMNPNHWPVNDWETITYLYEKPVYTDGTYRPCFPFMAESWKYLDSKTAVMTFRPGITFHDGTPFNAEAFKFQLEWIKDRQNGCFSRAWLQPIKSMEVLDPYTLKFQFDKPWSGFIGMMAYVPGYAMSAQALRKGGPKALETDPVGTGPYMLKEASPGNYLILQRNPNWWFGRQVGQPDMPYFDAAFP